MKRRLTGPVKEGFRKNRILFLRHRFFVVSHPQIIKLVLIYVQPNSILKVFITYIYIFSYFLILARASKTLFLQLAFLLFLSCEALFLRLLTIKLINHSFHQYQNKFSQILWQLEVDIVQWISQSIQIAFCRCRVFIRYLPSPYVLSSSFFPNFLQKHNTVISKNLIADKLQYLFIPLLLLLLLLFFVKLFFVFRLFEESALFT